MILRPSSADLWYHCPAQPAVATKVPEQPASEAAMEGTCAAWLAEMVLTNQAANCGELLGAKCPDNGFVVDLAMTHYIQKYVELIQSYGGSMSVERRVRLTQMIEGTPDAYAVAVNRTLIVDDLKYGFKIVEPTSKQVVTYGGGILNDLDQQGIKIDTVILGIYQPRASHPEGIHRTRSFPIDMFRQMVGDLIDRAALTQNPNAPAIPGKHCRYCKGASECAAVTNELYSMYERMTADRSRPMTLSELSNELSFLDKAKAVFDARYDSVQAIAKAHMDQGDSIPGWGRTQGRGKRRWKFPRDTIKAIALIDPAGESMATPLAMERAGVSPVIIDALTETPLTKAKLTPLTQDDIRRKFEK